MNKYKIGERDERVWGSFEVTNVEDGRTEKILTVLPGQRLSLQRHKHRAELWTVLEGECSVVKGEKAFDLKAGDQFFIEKGEWHRIINNSNEICKVHEVQTGDILDEEDIERKEDL